MNCFKLKTISNAEFPPMYFSSQKPQKCWCLLSNSENWSPLIWRPSKLRRSTQILMDICDLSKVLFKCHSVEGWSMQIPGVKSLGSAVPLPNAEPLPTLLSSSVTCGLSVTFFPSTYRDPSALKISEWKRIYSI